MLPLPDVQIVAGNMATFVSKRATSDIHSFEMYVPKKYMYHFKLILKFKQYKKQKIVWNQIFFGQTNGNDRLFKITIIYVIGLEST